MSRIGLLLAGNGLLDGSDPTQAVTLHVAIAEGGDVPLPFAPDTPQHDARHPVTGATLDAPRNALVEAARLVRGDCRAADRLQADQVDAVVVPGGLGVVKTLCGAAVDGVRTTVDPQVTRVLKAVVDAGKPVGVLDEGAVLLGTVLEGEALELAAPADAALRSHLEQLGHTCSEPSSDAPAEAVIDATHRVVSAMSARDLDAARAAHPALAVLREVRALLGAPAPAGFGELD